MIFRCLRRRHRYGGRDSSWRGYRRGGHIRLLWCLVHRFQKVDGRVVLVERRSCLSTDRRKLRRYNAWRLLNSPLCCSEDDVTRPMPVTQSQVNTCHKGRLSCCRSIRTPTRQPANHTSNAMWPAGHFPLPGIDRLHNPSPLGDPLAPAPTE